MQDLKLAYPHVSRREIERLSNRYRRVMRKRLRRGLSILRWTETVRWLGLSADSRIASSTGGCRRPVGTTERSLRSLVNLVLHRVLFGEANSI